MSWDPHKNFPQRPLSPCPAATCGRARSWRCSRNVCEISQRIVVHVSGISTLNPECIYRNVWKAIHTYQPTYRRKSAG